MLIILLSKLSRYLSFTIGLDHWFSGASKISHEFEPKRITNKRVLNIEVTAVTWSSPIAKKMYLRRKFYRVPRKVSCPQGQLFSKRRFLGFLFFYGYPAVFLTHNVQHASKVLVPGLFSGHQSSLWHQLNCLLLDFIPRN